MKKALLKKDDWQNGRYHLIVEGDFEVLRIRLDSNKNKVAKWFDKITGFDNRWYEIEENEYHWRFAWKLIVYLPEKPPIDIPVILLTEKDIE